VEVAAAKVAVVVVAEVEELWAAVREAETDASLSTSCKDLPSSTSMAVRVAEVEIMGGGEGRN
jgi:hypothetical protein